MADRLSALDASFLYLEEAATPMHVGGVGVFQAAEGFDYDRLVALVRERITLVPRYRQRIRWVPGRIANPVWVDDENFDVTYHVRRSAVPRPGSDEQLCDLVARIMSRRLDRDRPLWELYLVEGLDRDRFAVVTKTHHAMVDGITAVDIGQVILDRSPDYRPGPPPTWRPEPEPSNAALLGSALSQIAHQPTAAVEAVRSGLHDVKTTAGRVGTVARELASALRVAARPAPHSPLNVEIGKARRYATVETRLADYKAVRAHHGGTINDVVLATVTGALRSWLMMRGEPVRTSATVRALVPVSVHPPAHPGLGHEGNRVDSFLVDLPVGEPSPVVRLQRISFLMASHHDTGQAVGAEVLTGLAGFAPPTLHTLGARVGSDLSRRLFNLVVTNVPGPQSPLYAGGARMLAAYPVVPLSRGQALSVGATSYDGGVYYGLTADRDSMHDVGVLAQAVVDALDELRDTVRHTRGRVRPHG
jgi:WS/DGAT/MGAT family acyltransferase